MADRVINQVTTLEIGVQVKVEAKKIKRRKTRSKPPWIDFRRLWKEFRACLLIKVCLSSIDICTHVIRNSTHQPRVYIYQCFILQMAQWSCRGKLMLEPFFAF